jgi:hypothetical protein
MQPRVAFFDTDRQFRCLYTPHPFLGLRIGLPETSPLRPTPYTRTSTPSTLSPQPSALDPMRGTEHSIPKPYSLHLLS